MITDRQIRVFISSTFRDMQWERELLVKQVFPELRQICAQRFVTLTEVDLRWGITEEQAAEGKVLPICLEEIHLSRPYFIGLLGERYGWIPQSVPPSVISKEPWLQEHVGRRTSVTELEILHGVLNSPHMADHAYFYFRDPRYLERLHDSERAEFIERGIPNDVRAFGESEAARRTEERKGKLAALKQRIRQSGLPLLDNYPDPETFAVAVHEHLLALIDKFYPESATPDPLDQEALGHDSYAARKLLAYVPRPAHTAALDAFVTVESTSQGLVVTGDSGGGKTALLADWVRKWRDNHHNDFVFAHYFGSTPDSASASRFLDRLLGELKRRYDIPDQVPSQPDKVREALPIWLAQTAGRWPIVLVLDALNQIEGDEPDRRLAWLPRHFPPHVRVLASALPGLALDALRERGWAQHKLPLPDVAERGQMIDKFFEHYRKELGGRLRGQLAAAPGSANPLFLRTVLEELRQFGSFEQLPAKVGEYLAANTPEELFRLVLRRWQQDFDAGHDLVRRAPQFLWAARQGLSENEWRELLGRSDGPLLRQVWSPFFLAMEPHLALRAGLYTFGHDFLRKAVQAEFLPADVDRRAAHLALADYLERQAVGQRKAMELPWQLRECGDRDRLKRQLLDIPLFLLVQKRNQNELMGYWVWLEQERTMADPYLQSFERWAADRGEDVEVSVTANALSFFLHHASLFAEAEPLMQRALAISERTLGPDHPITLTNLNNLANLHQSRGNYAAAESLFVSVLQSRERVLGKEHPATLTSLSNLGLLLVAKGDYKAADGILARTLEISERVLGPEHPDTLNCVANLAGLYQSTGNYLAAESLFARGLKCREQVLGAEHPSTLNSLHNLAFLHQSKGDYLAAKPLYERTLEARERVLGKEHPDTIKTLNNLALLHVSKGNYAAAEPLLLRVLETSARVLGDEHPETLRSFHSLGFLYQRKGDYAAAKPLYETALKGYERALGAEHPDTLSCLNNLAHVHNALGKFAAAEPFFVRVLDASERALGELHPQTVNRLNSLAKLYFENQDYDAAEPLFVRAVTASERAKGEEHTETLTSVMNLAAVYYAKGDYPSVGPLLVRAQSASRRALGTEHPVTKAIEHHLAELPRRTGFSPGAPN